MNFFEVTAKCGHVGKGQFYMGLFYVRADNGSAAAAIVRLMPRVKHHHKDAILAVVKIEYDAFKAGQAEYANNPYFKCRNKQEQQSCLTDIESGIHSETNHGKRELRDNTDRQARLWVMRRHDRKQNKYGYNNYDIGA